VPASIHVVRHGKPARRVLEQLVFAHKEGDVLAPVTVVARSALAGLDLRRRLASPSGLANVRFSLLPSLAELFGAPDLMGAGRGVDHPRPLTAAALGAAVRAALDEEPGILAEAAGHSSTEAALAATYKDLRHAGPKERARLRSCGERAADVVRLAGRARMLLSGGWYDFDDVADAAASALDAGRVSLDDVGPVIVHLPDMLRSSEIRLLAALSRRTRLDVIVGVTGDEQTDSGPRSLAVALGESLECAVVEAGAARLDPACAPVVDLAGRHETSLPVSEVVSAPDPEVEVREAIRRILAHDPSGSSLGRCAIAHPGSGRYARLLAEQLGAAGIAWNGPAPRALAEVTEARALSGLVALARPPLELERAAFIGWLSRGPIITNQGEPVPSGDWDRTSREAGIVSGIDEWRSRLASHARRCSGDRPAESALALSLREFVEGVANSCGELLGCESWESFVRWSEAVLEEYLAPPDDDEHRQIVLALDELFGLDTLDPLAGLPLAVRHERISRSLATVLDRPAPRVGRYGHGVMVAPIASLVGVETDLLVVVGAIEGELPARSRDDPLLPSRERDRAGVPSLVRERAEIRDRRHLVALLSGAARSVLTSPRLDHRDGRPTIRSRWLDGDLASGAAATTVPSFASALHRVARGGVPACDALEYELASLQAWGETGRSAERHFLTASAPEFARALEVGKARSGAFLNCFNGLAGPNVEKSGAQHEHIGSLLSATTLETYATCPFRGFLGHQLSLRVVDAPERRSSIEPRDRGSLVHEVLQRLVEEQLESRRPWSGWTAEDHARLAQLAVEAFDDYERRGLVGKALFWQLEKSQILLDLDRFLDSDERFCRADGRAPMAAEYCFGNREVPPLELVAASRPVHFRGKVDRVDRGSDGSLTVVDYKTGSSAPFTILEGDPVGHGERLQLAIYSFAAERDLGPAGDRLIDEQTGHFGNGKDPHESGNGEDHQGAAVSRSPREVGSDDRAVKAEYRFVSWNADRESVGIVLDDHSRARLRQALDTLVAMIDDGYFPARPGNPDRGGFKNCQWCEFDPLCTADRYRAWQRIRSDVHLRDYVALVEPADLSADGDLDENGSIDAL